jgi:uncharacterized membrane protein
MAELRAASLQLCSSRPRVAALQENRACQGRNYLTGYTTRARWNTDNNNNTASISHHRILINHHEPLLSKNAFGTGLGKGWYRNVGKKWEGEALRGRRGVGCIRALALPAAPLIAAGDTWGTWTILLAAGAFGVWSERTTWGNALSGPLVSTLAGLAASNCGLIATSAPAYSVVNAYLLPLAVPLLLYGSDLRRVLADTGRLLLAFTVGAVATTIGTVVALIVVPLRSLGPDSWKIAAALMSRHIGGAVNYVAVSEALQTTPSTLAAGLAADNLICAIYFTSLFALAANIPPDAPTGKDEGKVLGFGRGELQVEEMAKALALSAAICALGTTMAKTLNFNGGGIPCITAIVVLLATIFPSWVGALGTSAEGLAVILLQVFFATVGANASIATVITKAPSLFIFSFIQVAVHLAIILGVGKLMGFERKELLLASNANVGGPTTAAGMAAAKGWRALSVPAILCGIFGIAIATFISIAFGVSVLSKM